MLQVGLPQGVECLGVGTQLSTDLRHVTVGAGRQHAGSGSIGTGSGSRRAGAGGLLTKPRNLTLEDGQRTSTSPPGSGPGVILLSDDLRSGPKPRRSDGASNSDEAPAGTSAAVDSGSGSGGACSPAFTG